MGGLTTAKTGQNRERLKMSVVQKMGAGQYEWVMRDESTLAWNVVTDYFIGGLLEKST
jgi:hypothetical protein